MERLGSEIPTVLRSAGAAQTGRMTEIVRAWPPAVGVAISRAAWPARLARDGTLHVATVSSTWAFELGRMEAEIAARLAEQLAEDPPSALRFAPGRVPEPALPEPATGEPQLIRPSPESVAEAARVVAGIDDPELRELVARAAAASLERARDGRPFW
jgi:hypothetical protein